MTSGEVSTQSSTSPASQKSQDARGSVLETESCVSNGLSVGNSAQSRIQWMEFFQAPRHRDTEQMKCITIYYTL